jgi:predicted GTPase
MKYFPNLLSIRSLIYLTVVLSMNGCKRARAGSEFPFAPIEIKNNPDESEKNYKDIEIQNNPCNTIVAFFGNPGVGKSAFCNSIFQRNEFKSGYDIGGITQKTQEYTIGDMRYIDTPGLDDVIRREEAAKEIEKP